MPANPRPAPPLERSAVSESSPSVFGTADAPVWSEPIWPLTAATPNPFCVRIDACSPPSSPPQAALTSASARTAMRPVSNAFVFMMHPPAARLPASALGVRGRGNTDEGHPQERCQDGLGDQQCGGPATRSYV